MTAAISPEGYVFIVGALFFMCSVALVLLAAAGYRATTRPSKRYPAFDYKAELAVKDRTRRGPGAHRQELQVAEELRRVA